LYKIVSLEKTRKII